MDAATADPDVEVDRGRAAQERQEVDVDPEAVDVDRRRLLVGLGLPRRQDDRVEVHAAGDPAALDLPDRDLVLLGERLLDPGLDAVVGERELEREHERDQREEHEARDPRDLARPRAEVGEPNRQRHG